MAVFDAGMNVEAIQASGTQLQNYESELKRAINDIGHEVASLKNDGAGFDEVKFQMQWAGVRLLLEMVAGEVGQMATICTDNAREQRTASS